MVSIIIPVYNVAPYLSKCLNSCLNQTYKDIEIIAINDGSTDGSAKILDEYKLKDKRIQIVHQINHGVVYSRKKGIELANGEYLMFIDSDDYIPCDSIELLLKAITENEADVSVGGFCNVDDVGKILLTTSFPFSLIANSHEIAIMLLEEKINFSLCGKLFSSKLFTSSIKHFCDVKMGEDALVTMQLLDKAKSVVIVNDIVYFYFQHNSSVTHNPSKQAVNTILKFINLTNDFYKHHTYIVDDKVRNALNYFIMKEFYTYLRLGGMYTSNEVKDIVNNQCLLDVNACSKSPFWRIQMLKAYKNKEILGRIVRCLILILRKFR